MVQVQQRDAEATVIALTGDLDGDAAGQLRELTAQAADTPQRVVIEMSGVTEVSAQVVGVLVGAWHRLEGRLTLRCSDPVYAVLEETGLDRLLPVA